MKDYLAECEQRRTALTRAKNTGTGATITINLLAEQRQQLESIAKELNLPVDAIINGGINLMLTYYGRASQREQIKRERAAQEPQK